MASEGTSLGGGWLCDGATIVEPAAFSARIEAEDALLCFSERIFSSFVDAFHLHGGEEGPRLPGALESKVDGEIAVYRGCFGAPAAGALMEALTASGVERFVMVGEAGAISPQCKIGDLLLPTWGVREEGTSYHYLPPGVRCAVSRDLLGAIRGYLHDVAFREGGVWTTDALFRETADKVQRFAEAGALAVEMECTALMAIAMVRQVAFAAALIITDDLSSGRWVQGFGRPDVARSQDMLCRALAEGFRRGEVFT